MPQPSLLTILPERRRKELACAAPAVVGFIVTVLSPSESWQSRLIDGLFAAFVVEIGAVIGMFLSTAAIKWLLQGHDGEIPDTRTLAAGMLLASVVWAWWQIDRDTVVERIAACAESTVAELPDKRVRTVVLDCYAEVFDSDQREDF